MLTMALLHCSELVKSPSQFLESVVPIEVQFSTHKTRFEEGTRQKAFVMFSTNFSFFDELVKDQSGI